MLLHVVATNHDPRTWDQPWGFRPERLVGVEPGPYEFVPQGGGPREGHRCPGEPAVVEVLRYLVARFAEDVEVSPTFDSTRMPTVPRRRLTRST